MKITLDIPKPLIDEAMELSHQNNKSAVIISALENFVRKNKISGLKKFMGKIDLDIDLDKLRDRK